MGFPWKINVLHWILHPVCSLCMATAASFSSPAGVRSRSARCRGGIQQPRRLSFLTHHFACCMSCLSRSLLRGPYVTCLNSSDNVHLNWPTLWARWQGGRWNLQPTGHACKCNICNCLCGRVILSCSALSLAIFSLALFFVAASRWLQGGNTDTRQHQQPAVIWAPCPWVFALAGGRWQVAGSKWKTGKLDGWAKGEWKIWTSN